MKENTKDVRFSEMEKVNRNLWKRDGKYYRLFGHSVTPNGCWIVAPEMVELSDIDVASGKDVYGCETLTLGGVTGTVPSHNEFETH